MGLTSPVVFPLFGILQTPDGPRCACGNAACARVGKHPAVAWGELEIGSPVPRPEPGAGYGLKTGAAPKGSGVFVVDLDGEAALEWWGEQPGASDPTYTVETGRGLQIYWEDPGFPVRNSAGDLAPDVDIRGDGGFVVGAGSPHRSGKTYTLLADVPPAPAPAWLLEWLRARPAPAAMQEYPGDVDGPELDRRRKLYASYLQTTPPCVQGRAGDQRLFEVVQRGAYDLALPVADVLELVREHFDPRCEPPWGDELDERVRHKAHSAKTGSTRPRAEPPPADLAELFGLTMPAPPPTEALSDAARPRCAWKIRRGGWENKPPPPRYLVTGLLLEGKVSMIFADSGSIKSWTAESIALAVATGEPWLGQRFVQRGPVLYVDFEDAEDEFNRRIYLLNQGKPADDLCYVYQPQFANDGAFWEELGHAIKDFGIRFVVIDTLAGATPTEDENDRRAATALQAAGKFSTDHDVTILFLHHANKNGDIRGTSAFKANVDSLFSLVTIKDSPDEGFHRARLVNTKSGQRKVPPVALELTDEGLFEYDEPEEEADGGEDDEGGDEENRKRTFDELEAAVLLAIEQNGPIATVDKLRALVNARRGAVSNAVVELIALEKVAKTERGYEIDDEDKRTARLVACVQAHRNWSREMIIRRKQASGAFFDRALDAGIIVRHTPGRVDTGYIVPGPVKPFPTP